MLKALDALRLYNGSDKPRRTMLHVNKCRWLLNNNHSIKHLTLSQGYTLLQSSGRFILFTTSYSSFAKRTAKFSVIGNSRGAELALLLGCYFPKISAVVAIVPSAYTWGAFNNYKLVTGSAWTYKGEQIPCIGNLNLIFYRPYWTIINKPERVEKFFIPVERLTASLLLLSGKNDNIWPSAEMSNRIMSRLDKFGYTQPYRHITYDNKGHDIIQNSVEDVLNFLKTNYPVKVKHITKENQIK